MEIWEASLKSKARYKQGQAAPVIFELKNVSDADRYVLVWDTPLEGLMTECLQLWHEDHKVAYDGVFSKRARPTEQDYKIVLAGGKITTAVDLSRAYSLALEGQYHLGLKLGRISSFVAASQAPDWLTQQLKNEEQHPHSIHIEREQPLQHAGVSFQVVEGKKTSRTWGALARQKHAKNLKDLIPDGHNSLIELLAVNPFKPDHSSIASLGIKRPSSHHSNFRSVAPQFFVNPSPATSIFPPTFSNGSAGERAVVQAAHFEAFRLCNAALVDLTRMAQGNLVAKGRFERWFGKFDQNLAANVFDNFRAMFAWGSQVISYDINGSICTPNHYAHSQGPFITLCSRFFAAPIHGADSQAGSIVHELSHAAVFTGDHAYSVPYALRLAVQQPDLAVDNADNYQYYAENV